MRPGGGLLDPFDNLVGECVGSALAQTRIADGDADACPGRRGQDDLGEVVGVNSFHELIGTK